MPRSVLLLTLLTVSLPAFLLWGNTAPSAPPAAMPWEVEVYRAYCPALVAEAHVADCWTRYVEEELHLVVVTATPALVPAEMDTIPTITEAPPAPADPQTPEPPEGEQPEGEQTEGEPPEAPSPPASMPWAVEVYRTYCPALAEEAHVADCWTGYVGEDLHIVVITDSPNLVPVEIDTIPTLTLAPPASSTEDDPDPSEADSPGTGSAPSGESGQDDSESSGSGTQQSGRSAEGESSTETQNPSIAGIPYATAVEIFSRQNFLAVAGVIFVWLDADGIVVMTNQPDLIPSTFEGLPVRTEPSGGFVFGMEMYGQP